MYLFPFKNASVRTGRKQLYFAALIMCIIIVLNNQSKLAIVLKHN